MRNLLNAACFACNLTVCSVVAAFLLDLVHEGDPPVGEDGGLLLAQVQVEAGIAQVGDGQSCRLPLQCGLQDLPCRHLCSTPVCLLDWLMLLPSYQDKCVG